MRKQCLSRRTCAVKLAVRSALLASLCIAVALQTWLGAMHVRRKSCGVRELTTRLHNMVLKCSEVLVRAAR